MIGFAAFFAEAHAQDGRPGPAPYPWQEALAHRLATASPPEAIVVPTGGGKTATIDAIVWALACQADRSPLLRTVGVRTVWAIDRRILVDEVHDHVSHLAARLGAAEEDAADLLHEVALALVSFTGDGPPLVATRWRGGLPAHRQPAVHPFQPQVITSTVAQVGSRLLFRGYGVGGRSLPVEAALAAVDSNVCLDEAHLAEPFRETVAAIAEHRAAEPVALPPLNLMTLTATPLSGVDPGRVVSISEEDRIRLGVRLTGRKDARLIDPESDRERRGALVAAVGAHLADGARTVACVVNSVKTAIECHAAIVKAHPKADHMMLIGPQRPADRSRLLARHHATLFERATPARALVVVATQTFEVGLDADVEALVTESASSTALVQRLGRLNRAGLRDGVATIVRAAADGLYEEEEPATWTWLRGLERPDGSIDVSVEALSRAEGRPSPVRIEHAPALTTDVLDRLVQTEPRPAPLDDPDIDVFLRGARSEPAGDIAVAWRDDLRDEDRDALPYREALLRLAPPDRTERLTLGIGRARALLAALRSVAQSRARAGGRILDEPDLEGGSGGAELSENAVARSFLSIVLRGDEHVESFDQAPALRPGDVLVLPGWVGGYAGGALDPGSSARVEDVAPDRRVSGAQASPGYWRLSEQALGHLGPGVAGALLRAAAQAAREEPGGDALTALVAALAAAHDTTPGALGLAGGVRLELRSLIPPPPDFFAETGDGFGLELEEDDAELDEIAMSDDERTPRDEAYVLVVRPALDALRAPSAPPPTLDAHARAVSERLAGYVGAAALPEDLAALLVVAARAHDHGKADPRTQAFFRGGTVGLGDVTIAKSVFGTQDLQASRAARRASGWPIDLRHEVESVEILQDALADQASFELSEPRHAQLLLHAVGTHHGLGRPIPRRPRGGAPARPFAVSVAGIRGRSAGDGRAAWGEGAWLDRFLSVHGDYGAWGAAYLCALLVLADRAVSGEGS